MSDDVLNIRFGVYHLHLTTKLKLRWGKNPYQEKLRQNDPRWKWFQLHEFAPQKWWY